MLGLLLGDGAAAAGGITAAGPLAGTGAGQLACFTVDALIRDDIRAAHRGVTHPQVAVWASYRRWGRWQGMLGPATPPDGWLATVPVLGAARGAAPAIVAALRAKQAGTLDAPVGSTGADAVTLTLPVGMALHADQPGHLTRVAESAGGLAARIAALAHRDEAVTAAAVAAATVVVLRHERSIEAAVRAAATHAEPYRRGEPIPLDTALDAAGAAPFDLETFRRLAPDASAGSALVAAVPRTNRRTRVGRPLPRPLVAVPAAGTPVRSGQWGGRHSGSGVGTPLASSRWLAESPTMCGAYASTGTSRSAVSAAGATRISRGRPSFSSISTVQV